MLSPRTFILAFGLVSSAAYADCWGPPSGSQICTGDVVHMRVGSSEVTGKVESVGSGSSKDFLVSYNKSRKNRATVKKSYSELSKEHPKYLSCGKVNHGPIVHFRSELTGRHKLGHLKRVFENNRVRLSVGAFGTRWMDFDKLSFQTATFNGVERGQRRKFRTIHGLKYCDVIVVFENGMAQVEYQTYPFSPHDRHDHRVFRSIKEDLAEGN